MSLYDPHLSDIIILPGLMCWFIRGSRVYILRLPSNPRATAKNFLLSRSIPPKIQLGDFFLFLPCPCFTVQKWDSSISTTTPGPPITSSSHASSQICWCFCTSILVYESKLYYFQILFKQVCLLIKKETVKLIFQSLLRETPL